MTTLRRDLRHRFNEILIDYPLISDLLSGRLADAALELLGFKTWENKPFTERQEELKDFMAENSLEAAIILGKPLGKAAQKVKESIELDSMIDAQLARLKMNWQEFDEKDKDYFRRFLKEKRKVGQELETWVNWWMSDEWQVAHSPWKLETIRTQWLKGFQVVEKSIRPEHQRVENDNIKAVPNPNKTRPNIPR